MRHSCGCDASWLIGTILHVLADAFNPMTLEIVAKYKCSIEKYKRVDIECNPIPMQILSIYILNNPNLCKIRCT